MTGGRAARGWAVPSWVVVLTLAVSAPVLRSGYVLSYDMVAVPRQSFLPDSFGLGEALPRAVPAEAVTVALTHLVAGQLVQKALLVTCLLLAGLGAARLVPSERRLVAAVGATAYVWNPFVAERLVLGHWWLLLGYAVLPWLVLGSARVARGEAGALPVLLLLVALGSLVPSAGLISCLVVVVVLSSCSDWSLPRVAARRLATVTVALVVLQAPWWLPGLLHGSSEPGASAALFAARAESVLGVIGSVVGLGGAWNADVVPESRGLPVAVVGTLVALLGAGYGLRPLRERFPDGEGRGLLVLGGLGLLLALWTSWSLGADALEALSRATQGFGLLRDAQKFVGLWALPLCVLVALAAERLAARVRDPAGAAAVLVGALLLPLVVLPDLAWGVAGRLVPVGLPPGWTQTRETLLDADAPGDVLVLPWGAFRQFAFNDRRTSLDPAPRWLPRPSVVDGRLVVATPEGGTALGVVGSESERGRAVEDLLADGGPGADGLAALGIGWVVVERGTPGSVPAGFLDGTEQVLADPEVDLYQVPGARPGPGWGDATQVVLVLATDVAVLVLLVGAGVAVLRTRREQPWYAPRTFQGEGP